MWYLSDSSSELCTGLEFHYEAADRVQLLRWKTSQSSHSIIEYAEMEGTHQAHQVKFLALGRTP